MADIKVLFWDIGGVSLSNGWDRERRERGTKHFGLSNAEFEYRHKAVDRDLEVGRISLDQYLNWTMFHQPRSFTVAEVREFMCAQTEPRPEVIAFARALRDTRRWLMVTLNNESAEINQFRIAKFGLRDCFDMFLSSCYLRTRKPELAIYEQALRITQRLPEECVFIDDRPENLEPARSLGIHGIRFESLGQLQRELADLGVAP